MEQVLSLIRVLGQVVELTRAIGVTKNQLPLFVPDHPDRAVLVKYDYRAAAFQLWILQPSGKTVARDFLFCVHRAAGQMAQSGQDVVVAEQLTAHSPFREMPWPGGDERHLYRTVVHILRESPVSLAPDAVLSQVHAVVGGEDNDGVVCDPQLIQAVHQTPDLVIHGCDGGVVAPQ